MSDGCDAQLRSEILETQKARSDLLKWKLVLVAAIGSVGLGLIENSKGPYAPFVLCGIPFVCLYVDILCAHLNLRIIVINRYFMLRSKGSDADYESLCTDVRDVFSLETWALRMTTALLSGLLVLLGVGVVVSESCPRADVLSAISQQSGFGIAAVASGLLCLIFTCMVQTVMKRKLGVLDKVVAKKLSECPGQRGTTET